MQTVLFQVNWMFCLVFITSFVIVTFKMELLKKQIICIKFCLKVRRTSAETHDMLCEAYGDDALSQTMTIEGFRRFKSGRTSADGKQCG
jgi:hypothetical protein